MRLRSAVILANKLFAFERSSSSIKNITVDTELGIFKSDINLSLSLLKKIWKRRERMNGRVWVDGKRWFISHFGNCSEWNITLNLHGDQVYPLTSSTWISESVW